MDTDRFRQNARAVGCKSCSWTPTQRLDFVLFAETRGWPSGWDSRHALATIRDHSCVGPCAKKFHKEESNNRAKARDPHSCWRSSSDSSRWIKSSDSGEGGSRSLNDSGRVFFPWLRSFCSVKKEGKTPVGFEMLREIVTNRGTIDRIYASLICYSCPSQDIYPRLWGCRVVLPTN